MFYHEVYFVYECINIIILSPTNTTSPSTFHCIQSKLNCVIQYHWKRRRSHCVPSEFACKRRVIQMILWGCVTFQRVPRLWSVWIWSCYKSPVELLRFFTRSCAEQRSILILVTSPFQHVSISYLRLAILVSECLEILSCKSISSWRIPSVFHP